MEYRAARFPKRLSLLIRVASLASVVAGTFVLVRCNSDDENNSSTSTEKPSVTLSENSVGVVDAATSLVVARIAVGQSPSTS
jgi:YVTN family beta-propeller protein